MKQIYTAAFVATLMVLIPANVNAADGRTDRGFIVVNEFRIEIDYVTQGEFKAVDGLEVKIEVIESEEGDELMLRRRPTRNKVDDIVFRPVPSTWEPLWSWWQECEAGECASETVSIHSFDESQTKTGTWELKDAVPKKVVKDDDGLEEVTFKYSQLTFTEPK